MGMIHLFITVSKWSTGGLYTFKADVQWHATDGVHET